MLDHLYRKRPLILAHRGALRAAPENTLPAFRQALALGADGFELDAKLTADGVPIVMHDATVERTTDGSGRVAGLTLDEVRALDAGSWFDFEFRGVQVPTLDEVLAEFGGPAIINIELTNYTTARDGLEARVLGLVHRHNAGRRVILSSFNPFSIRRVKRLDPAIPTALLTSLDLPIWLRRAWFAPFVPHEARHPEVAQVNEGFLAQANRKHLRVNAWLPAAVDETPEMLNRLNLLGVHGLICNRPEVARAALRPARQPHRRSQK